MIEIERKFLVVNENFIRTAASKSEIKQGYLNSDPNRTVRIRINTDKGYITIKGISNETGLSRFEWEKEIPLDEAKILLQLSENNWIAKTRYEVPYGKHIFEVDVFEDSNKGLIIAEIELNNEDDFFEKPTWLGAEVTNDKRYYNSYLSINPYLTW